MELTQIKELIEEQQKAFHEFKATNDERLKELEKGSTGVAELEGKLEKINAELDRLDELKAEIERVETIAARPEGAAALVERAKAAKEHKAAFATFVRKGIDNGLQDLEIQAAVSTGSDADGGYAIPEELDRQILSLLIEEYAMRRLANVLTLGGGEYKKIVNLHGAASGWVGETDARTETGTPALAALTPFMGEIYAYPMATQKALDDIFFDVEAWLVDECTLAFSEEEGGAFVSGDGSKKPKGFLAYNTSTDPDGTRAFGTIQYRETSAASTISFDDVIDLEYDLKEGHLAGAVYLAKRSTVRVLRKLKGKDDNYIWQPSAQAGEPSMLNGYPFYTDPGMPALADNAFALAFGNFRRGYTIVDRLGTRVLRDPYTNKPYVGFYIGAAAALLLIGTALFKMIKGRWWWKKEELRPSPDEGTKGSEQKTP